MANKVVALNPVNEKSTENEANVNWPERYVSIIGGAILGYSGLKNLFSSPASSIIKLGAAGYLLSRGITGNCVVYDQLDKYMATPVNINIRSSFIIKMPRRDVYNFWRRFDNLPLFMSHLKSVDLLPNDHSRWVLKMPAGVPNLSWEAEITRDEPNEVIGWSSIPGSVIETSGKVRFRDVMDGEATKVDVVITYQPPVGTLGGKIARLFNPVFKKMVEKDIQNFKHFMDIDYAEDTVNYL
jgi:uncharacterized membrane protein